MVLARTACSSTTWQLAHGADPHSRPAMQACGAATCAAAARQPASDGSALENVQCSRQTLPRHMRPHPAGGTRGASAGTCWRCWAAGRSPPAAPACPARPAARLQATTLTTSAPSPAMSASAAASCRARCASKGGPSWEATGAGRRGGEGALLHGPMGARGHRAVACMLPGALLHSWGTPCAHVGPVSMRRQRWRGWLGWVCAATCSGSTAAAIGPRARLAWH